MNISGGSPRTPPPVGFEEGEALRARKPTGSGGGAARAGKAAVVGDSFEVAKAGIADPSLAQKPSVLPPNKPKKRSSGGGFFSWVGRGLRRVGSALRGLATGVVSAVKGVVKNVVEAGRTLIGGIGKLFRGEWREGLRQIGLAAVKVVQTPVDAAVMLGGRAVSAVQTVLGLEPVGRKLEANEVAALRRVYGDSIDYGRVRIKEGSAGLFSVSGKPFTHGDTIYIPGKSLTRPLLVHEMAHVWQHQNGGTDYLSEALWAQHLGEGYDYEKVLDRGQGWRDMNPEQQARFLERAFEAGFFDEPSSGGFLNRRSGADYTAALLDALRDVRAGKGAP